MYVRSDKCPLCSMNLLTLWRASVCLTNAWKARSFLPFVTAKYHVNVSHIMLTFLISTFSFSGCAFFLYLVAYLSSYHEKALNALYELAEELPATCLPHHDRENPAKCLSQRHNK